MFFFPSLFGFGSEGWAHGGFAYTEDSRGDFSVEQICRKKNMSCSIVRDEGEENLPRNFFFFPLL